VHTTLDRLAVKGLVRATTAGAPAPGRARKTFALTPDGRTALGRAYATWARMTRGLKPKLESL
jgi:DNA-binding PadR family transcriptional regulator